MGKPARALSTPREHPILFSGEMVRAILSGRKTQTRRPIRVPNNATPDCQLMEPHEVVWNAPSGGILTPVPRHTGDRLWVRETWCSGDRYYQSHENEVPAVVGYRADRSAIQWDAEPPRQIPAYDIAQWNWDMAVWRPSIHMPRWASRITLEITGVRVERLQDISEEDAIAEGMPLPAGPGFVNGEPATVAVFDARLAFRALWDATYAKSAPWSNAPWVWVIAFKRVEKERP